MIVNVRPIADVLVSEERGLSPEVLGVLLVDGASEG